MRIFQNLVSKGIQADLDYAITPNENYLDAHNLTLTGTGKFLSLENIRGTLELETILSTFTGELLAVYANKYTIGVTPDVECLTIFTAQSDVFRIFAYDLQNDTTYSLYQETVSGLSAANPLIDAVCYPENGLDILYFTDNVNEIRKLKCSVPSGYTPNFLTSPELSLQRRGTLAGVNLDSVQITGGSLLCGSYQFSLRFYNEDRQTYTKWSIPSSPINISQITSNVGLGSYNAVSAKYIRLKIDVPEAEFDLYTHYQLAVIENTQAVNSLNASLLKLEDLVVSSTAGGFDTFYHDYKSNIRIDFVPITDIVVDLAAISHVKTLQVKNNKLFAGNVTYTSLSYDNGDPEITGSIQRVTVDNVNDFQTSTRKGMWRDEVYRYYVSYYDTKYNFSRPKMLDMSAVTDNQVANGDLKTPSKKKSSYTLLDGSSNMTNLNLSLTIDNHPSWARGFVILRAKRKARVKFQSPFVPSCLVEGIDVIGSYPTEFKQGDSSGTLDTVTVENATPMNPIGTHIPKNFHFPVRRDYVREVNGSAVTLTQAGEVNINDAVLTTSSNNVYFAYPPDTYTTGTSTRFYTFNDGDKYEVVDLAFLKQYYTSFNTLAAESNVGNFLDSSVHSTFFARSIGDYYFSNGSDRSDPGGVTMNGNIVNYKELDNLGQGTQIGGYSVGEFDNLNTVGIEFNTKPSNQKSGVCQLDAVKLDSSYYGQAASLGLTSSSGATVTNGFYEAGAANQSNTFTPNKGGWVENSSYVSLLDIVNVITEQSDDRYGDPEDLHDIVYTGANYAFNATQVTNIQATGASPVTLSVAGGDCYTSLHQFKITDSHYGLVNVEKNGAGAQLDQNDLGKRWEKLFINKYAGSGTTDGRRAICMPVPYRNCSQVIAVVIESEVNGDLLAPRVYPITGGTYQDEDENEFNLRTPFTYIYNANYSKESNQKAFIPFDDDEVETTDFPARVLFSDQKVYNTFIDGFDVWRVASTADLEETYGGITKLSLVGDRLIALQEKAIVELPVDAAIAETTDGKTLSIRSGIVVDIPRYISRQYGCQHIKGVAQIDSTIFFPDNINKVVVRFDGQLELINETGMIKNFETLFSDQAAERYISSLFDNKRRQYWLWSREAGNTNCWIWDDRLKCWISNYEFASDTLLGGTYTRDEVHLMGRATHLKAYKMYSGTYSSLMGTTVTPRVKLSLNPEFETSKTFDDVIVYSSADLATADMITETDSGLNQSVLGMNIASVKREGSYRFPTLRDASNGRLRGLRCVMTLYWSTGDTKVSLKEVVIKYRPSYRFL